MKSRRKHVRVDYGYRPVFDPWRAGNPNNSFFSGMSDALRLVPFSRDATCLTGAYIQIHEMHRMQKLYGRLSTWSDHTEEIWRGWGKTRRDPHRYDILQKMLCLCGGLSLRRTYEKFQGDESEGGKRYYHTGYSLLPPFRWWCYAFRRRGFDAGGICSWNFKLLQITGSPYSSWNNGVWLMGQSVRNLQKDRFDLLWYQTSGFGAAPEVYRHEQWCDIKESEEAQWKQRGCRGDCCAYSMHSRDQWP